MFPYILCMQFYAIPVLIHFILSPGNSSVFMNMLFNSWTVPYIDLPQFKNSILLFDRLFSIQLYNTMMIIPILALLSIFVYVLRIHFFELEFLGPKIHILSLLMCVAKSSFWIGCASLKLYSQNMKVLLFCTQN